MKCVQCGAEFSGNFCSNCGCPVTQTQSVVQQPVNVPQPVNIQQPMFMNGQMPYSYQQPFAQQKKSFPWWIFAIVAGVLLADRMRIKLANSSLHWRQHVILTEAVVLGAVTYLPVGGGYDLIANTLISFVCSLQVESFRKFGEHAFASTMCTGNLRIATEHLNRYFSEKNRDALDTALRYYGIDLVFASAVLVGYWVTRAFGVRAVWWATLSPAALLVLLRKEEAR